MIGVLALVLFLLLILIGGDRGAVAVLALCGNIAVLAFTVILLANGAPPFLVIFAATLSISYITLLKQNGNNLKTRSALLSVALIMFALSICIYLGVWKTGSGGLSEIQMIQEDVQLYYTMDIDIHMQQIAAGIVILSALGAVMDTALSVTSAVACCQNCVKYFSVSIKTPSISNSTAFIIFFLLFCQHLRHRPGRNRNRQKTCDYPDKHHRQTLK